MSGAIGYLLPAAIGVGAMSLAGSVGSGGPGPLSGTANLVNQGMGALGMNGQPANMAGAGTPTMGASGFPTTAAAGQPPQVPTMGGPTAGNAAEAGAYVGLGEVGQQYFNYLNQRKLVGMQQRTAYAPEHSTPMSQMPQQIGLLPSQQFVLPQIG